MAAKGGLPLVLSDRGEKPEGPRSITAWDRVAVISSRILKACILGVTAAAVVFAAVAVGDPAVLLADATTFLGALSGPPTSTREEMPIDQSVAPAQASPPIASEAPAVEQTAAPVPMADPSQAENRQASAENLLGHFQSWAASNKDAPAVASTAQTMQPAQPVQDAQQTTPADHVQQADQAPQAHHAQQAHQVEQADQVQDALAEVRPVRKYGHEYWHARPVKNAQAEIRVKQGHLAKVRRERNARVPVQRAQAQAAEAQELPAQPAQTPSFLQNLIGVVHN